LKAPNECWTLDTLRGVGLSSNRNLAIQAAVLSRESQNLSRHSPKTDRPRAGPLFAEGEYETHDASPVDALQFVCRRQTFAADSVSGCALECIHTYSLVHDDLPSMDNDDFRRGRPTCHKVFGEGIAVLAGDALLTIAFEIVSRAKPTRRYDMSTLLREIAVAAGSQKLIAGQVADLEAEGKNVQRRELQFIHENKTAAILRTSVRLGGMSANADARTLSGITRFGERLGLAFQVIDDILDVTQTSEILGKSAGKDVAAKKATYPAVIGLEKSRAEARRLTREAHNALSIFSNRDAEALHALANYLLEREY